MSAWHWRYAQGDHRLERADRSTVLVIGNGGLIPTTDDKLLLAQAPKLLELVRKAEQTGAQQYGGGEDVPMRSAWMWLANQCKGAIEASTHTPAAIGARAQAERGAK